MLHDAYRRHPIGRPQSTLADLGTPACQDFPLAGTQEGTLDRRSPSKTRTDLRQENCATSVTRLQKQPTTSSPNAHSPEKCGVTSRRLLPATAATLKWWCRLRSAFSDIVNTQVWTHSLHSPGRQVWKERNFRDSTTTIIDLLLVIRAEADQSIMAGASKLAGVAQGAGA